MSCSSAQREVDPVRPAPGRLLETLNSNNVATLADKGHQGRRGGTVPMPFKRHGARSRGQKAVNRASRPHLLAD